MLLQLGTVPPRTLVVGICHALLRPRSIGRTSSWGSFTHLMCRSLRREVGGNCERFWTRDFIILKNLTWISGSQPPRHWEPDMRSLLRHTSADFFNGRAMCIPTV